MTDVNRQESLAGQRLLFVVNDARFFLTHRLELAKAARGRGMDVHVATPSSAHAKEVEHQGFAWHPFEMERRGLSPIRDVRSLLRLQTIYRTLKPDIVHHLTMKPVILGGLAAAIVGVPAVVHAIPGLGHTFSESGTPGKSRRVIAKAGLRVAFAHKNLNVIFQNDEDRETLAPLLPPRTRSVVIRGSGVDVAAFARTAPQGERPIVMMIARLLWTKGVGEFVETARALKNHHTSPQFVLVGEPDPGNPASVPVETIKEWHNEQIIDWWGWQNEMPPIINQATLVCHPSFYGEGVPKALIEAAAGGRPSVTSDMPGCRDIVQDNVNGFIVPPRDVGALKLAVEKLLDDPELCKRMGEAGRVRVESEFSLDRVNSETFAVYRELLRKRRSEHIPDGGLGRVEQLT